MKWMSEKEKFVHLRSMGRRWVYRTSEKLLQLGPTYQQTLNGRTVKVGTDKPKLKVKMQSVPDDDVWKKTSW